MNVIRTTHKEKTTRCVKLYIHAIVVEEKICENYTTIFWVMASLTRWSTFSIMINNKCEKICIILKMMYNLEQLFHTKFH
jgi:hypothetical protein